MKKKTTIIFFVALLLLLSNGCTLHFKGENIELETQPPEAKIGNRVNPDSDYQLVAVDLLKNVGR